MKYEERYNKICIIYFNLDKQHIINSEDILSLQYQYKFTFSNIGSEVPLHELLLGVSNHDLK